MQNDEPHRWEPVTRSIHWFLIVGFLFAYTTGEDTPFLHAYFGYSAILLIIARIVLGFVGPLHGRFAHFLRGPVTVAKYTRSLLRGESARFPGHNPIGGWMIVALLGSIGLTCWSGLEVNRAGHDTLAAIQYVATKTEPMRPTGTHYENGVNTPHTVVPQSTRKSWERTHKFLAGASLLLVLIHVSGIIVAAFLQHENLMHAMVSGLKQKIRDSE